MISLEDVERQLTERRRRTSAVGAPNGTPRSDDEGWLVGKGRRLQFSVVASAAWACRSEVPSGVFSGRPGNLEFTLFDVFSPQVLQEQHPDSRTPPILHGGVPAMGLAALPNIRLWGGHGADRDSKGVRGGP